MKTRIEKTIEIKRDNFTYVVKATSLYLVGFNSGYGNTYYQLKLKHSNEGVGYAKMTRDTTRRIILHTEENAKFFR
jgi:hypothetical protein